jgi:hypothetical protein
MLIADWQSIAHSCKHHVNDNLQRANWEQCQFDYALGEQDLKKEDPTKLGERMGAPYTIEPVHVNGNLTILLHEEINECINIRRVLTYCLPFHIPL